MHRLRPGPPAKGAERDVHVLAVERHGLGQHDETGHAFGRLADQTRQDLALHQDLPDGVVGQRGGILRPFFRLLLEVEQVVLVEGDERLRLLGLVLAHSSWCLFQSTATTSTH
jgi:hypothetical protein